MPRVVRQYPNGRALYASFIKQEGAASGRGAAPGQTRLEWLSLLTPEITGADWAPAVDKDRPSS